MGKVAVLPLLAALLLAAPSCHRPSGDESREIKVVNTSAFPLTGKGITLARDSLVPGEGKAFPVLLTEDGDTVASQTDDLDGDGKWDRLCFVTTLPAGDSTTLRLHWVASPLTYGAPRTQVRFGVRRSVSSKVIPASSDTFYADQLPHVIGYQRYQTDGPTWENDKVGFRLYLDGRNAIDVFGKKVSRMTPQDVGIGKDGFTEDNYSVMRDWGTDILDVENSLGIGGVSLLIDDALARLGITEADSVDNVRTTVCRVLASGPVASALRFDFNHWTPMGRDYGVTETVAIWPGTYAYSNTVSFRRLRGDETVVVGLVNSMTDHKPTEVRVNKDWVVLFTDDKQSVNKTWWLGLALILPANGYEGYMTAPRQGSVSKTFLAKLRVQPDTPLHYFAVAGWGLSDPLFRDSASFRRYLTDLTDQLSARVEVTVR